MNDSSTSFSYKLKQGWSKEQLQNFYALDDREYEKILLCLKDIHMKVGA